MAIVEVSAVRGCHVNGFVRRAVFLAVAASLCSMALSASVATAAPFPARKLSARTLAKDAAVFLTHARSFRITGSISSSGGSHVNVETFSNGDLTGTVVEGRNSLDIESVNHSVYVHAPIAYWEKEGVNQAIAQLIAPLWLSLPSTPSINQLTNEFLPSRFASMLTARVGHKLTLRKARKVDGIAAFGVSMPRMGTWWIAAAVPHRPVLFVSTSTGGSLIFSEWNKFSPPRVPQNAKSLSSL